MMEPRYSPDLRRDPGMVQRRDTKDAKLKFFSLAGERPARKKHRTLFIVAIVLIAFSGIASAAERLAVIGKIVNIRSGPGTKYDILCEAETFYPVILIEKSGNWYKVKDFEGDVGYIYKSLVGKVSSVITVKEKCNIRSGPGIEHDVLFISNRGVPFKVLDREGKWIHVQHAAGHEGWIHTSLVW
jgi:SH3-like domain-containing protein